MTATATPIREWARTHGYAVADRGRIAPAIHAAYRAAHPEHAAERPSNAAHCPHCGRLWTASRECHCSRCHRQFSSVRWFDDHMQGPDAHHGRPWCRDPLTIPVSRNDSTPKYKIIETAWGNMYILASERPESFDNEPTLL